ncbi:hypothetical protein Tco_1108547 [Tanacetum coccineum]
MSETEPIPPTSSVTALRIPIIKKGEYDLWSMKMRQYIAITDHILWDIITNGNQTTTDPASPSVSAPKTSLAANARRNNEKALNILLSAIPDRHLLSFHDAVDARSLWKAIKGRFGGKKHQKIDAKESPSTVACCGYHDSGDNMCLDELDFDDLYNNLKVMSMIEGTYPKRIYSSYLEQGANCLPTVFLNSDEIIYAMEEIDIRWQVAMITARIRKFMRKTGRSIDLKPKNGITFDKSKIECFNCQKLVTYAMMALTGVEQDDWSIEFDAEHMHFGQDGLDDFDWSNKADDAPISLALMATNSE